MTLITDLHTVAPYYDLQLPRQTGSLETITLSDDEGKPFSIDTYGVNGRTGTSKRTIFICQSWSDFVGREFMQRRMDLIAEVMNALVIGIDNSGIGLNTSSLTKSMSASLLGGDWSTVSTLQWKALEQNSLYATIETDELMLLCYSLGTSAAAAMTAYAPEGKEIHDIILWESAAFEGLNFWTLIKRYIRHGGDDWKRYILENPSWVPDPSSRLYMAKNLIDQPAGHVLYPYAMTKTPINALFRTAYAHGVLTARTNIHIINGTASKISPNDANDTLAHQLMRLPVHNVIRTALTGETHGMIDSFPRVASVIKHVIDGD